MFLSLSYIRMIVAQSGGLINYMAADRKEQARTNTASSQVTAFKLGLQMDISE
jgi:hypothetical protein